MFFVSKKRYNELERKNECLSKENMALRTQKCDEMWADLARSEANMELIEKLQTERDEYKKLYLDELQKRLELADQIRLRWG